MIVVAETLAALTCGIAFRRIDALSNVALER